MFRIKIRHQRGTGERWNLVGEATTDLTKSARLPDAKLSESDLISMQIHITHGSMVAARVSVGSVLVASTIHADRVTLIDYEDGDSDPPPLVCRGRFLADWVGMTELVVAVRFGDSENWWHALRVRIAVSAGKIPTERFNQLFSELEHDSAAVLLDVYGKTQVGLKGTKPLALSAPVAVLSRLRVTVNELKALLQQIERNPASRLRPQTSREQALVGQAISEDTLAEACRDPGMLRHRGSSLLFHEHLREHSRPDYRLAEHQVIADFGEYLSVQLLELRGRIDAEIEDRTDRRQWRDQKIDAGQKTWWEAEDLPRIEELQRCRQELGRLRQTVAGWSGLVFLPPGRCLRKRPMSTPLFRNHPTYRRVFRLITDHFLTYQATLDNHLLMTQARSLPVLYEWWCAVQVIRILARGLAPLPYDTTAGSIISTRLAPEGCHFTIEFAPDQAINFMDRNGARVRFRYQPRYLDEPSRHSVAPLDVGRVRLPDMTLELYPAAPKPIAMPKVIVVFDAKYTVRPQWEKLTEVSTKYSKLGDAGTGRILSRQVWAMTPMPPVNPPTDGLRRYCTIDNEAFWSQRFDETNPVNGAVQTLPVRDGEFNPLAALIVRLLEQFGMKYDEGPVM